jgi:hypothetical protein
LSKFKLPLKKSKQEKEERKLLKEKKKQKEERKELGHYIPKYELDRIHENHLKSIAMKGGTIISFSLMDSY